MGKLFKSKSEKLLEKYGVPKKIEYWNFIDDRNPSFGKKYSISIEPYMRKFNFEKGIEERLYLNIKLDEIVGIEYKNKYYWDKPAERIEKPIMKLIFSDNFPLTKDNPVKNMFYNIHSKYGLEKKFIRDLFDLSICDLLKQRKKRFDPNQIKNCSKR